MRSLVAAALVIVALSSILVAQASQTAPEKKMDTLMVYGDGFLFSMKEPDGWHCVCDSGAAQYGVNAIVFPSSPGSRAHHVEIKVRLNEKSDEDTLKDLQADMQQYKKKYPKVQFALLDIAHPEYKTYQKLFLFPNDYYEYVTYLNPGRQHGFTISIWMSKEKTPATREELAAYSTVLRSVQMITTDLQISH